MRVKVKTIDPEANKERQLKQPLYKQQQHAERNKSSIEKDNHGEEIVAYSSTLSNRSPKIVDKLIPKSQKKRGQ